MRMWDCSERGISEAMCTGRGWEGKNGGRGMAGLGVVLGDGRIPPALFLLNLLHMYLAKGGEGAGAGSGVG